MIVVRIENFRDRAREVVLLDRLVVLAAVEGGQLELVDRLGVPDAERVDDAIFVADDRNVIRHREHGAVVLVDELVLAGRRVVLDPRVAAEAHFLLMLRALQLEGIDILQPVVRNLLLEAVFDLLLEHAVMIADAAAVSVIAERRQRIHEAGRKPPEAAISERGIRLLVLERVDVDAELVERLLHIVVRAEVQQVVAERAADQELHRQVVNRLALLLQELGIRIHPVLDDLVLDDLGDCLEDLLLRSLADVGAVALSHGGLDVLDEPLLVEFLRRFLLHTDLCSCQNLPPYKFTAS